MTPSPRRCLRIGTEYMRHCRTPFNPSQRKPRKTLTVLAVLAWSCSLETPTDLIETCRLAMPGAPGIETERLAMPITGPCRRGEHLKSLAMMECSTHVRGKSSLNPSCHYHRRLEFGSAPGAPSNGSFDIQGYRTAPGGKPDTCSERLEKSNSSILH